MDINIEDLLDLSMDSNEANAFTIREYLSNVLLALWFEGDDFCPDSPFGDCEWKNEIYSCLCEHRIIDGVDTSDDSDYKNYEFHTTQEMRAHSIIGLCISEMGTPSNE